MKQGNQYVHPQAEITLFSKGIFHKNKSTDECFYCKRRVHTTLNCKIHASDLLNGKLKELANIAISKEISDAIYEFMPDFDSDCEVNTEPLKLF